MLRRLGCRVLRRTAWQGEPADLLVALHAVKSAPSLQRWQRELPGAPAIVAVTGTDVHDPSAAAQFASSLALADAVIVLQPRALDLLPADARAKATVIRQSVELPSPSPPRTLGFDVCVLANLRDVKRPLLAAQAACLLPASSRVRVILAGAALDPQLADAARAQMQRSLRFTWLGALPRPCALRLLQGARAMVSSSRSEGGANVVGEAIVAGVPPLVTAIPGSLGLLGADWPAQFPVDDADALAALLLRCERDAAFLADLHARLRALAPAFARSQELAAWRALLRQVAPRCERSSDSAV